MPTLAWKRLLSWGVAALLSAGANGGEMLPCAGQDGHAWVVLPVGRQADSFDLCHHSVDLAGAFYKPLLRLPESPLAMASWGSQVWLALPPTSRSSGAGYEVYSVKVQRDPALGIYQVAPSGRMEIVPPLPGEWRLASLAANSNGPIALLMPATLQVTSTQPDPPVHPRTSPRLLQLRGERWIDLPVPERFSTQGQPIVATTGKDGTVLVLLGHADGNQTLRCVLEAGGAWRTSSVGIDVGSIRDAVSVFGQAVLVSDQKGTGELALGFLREHGVAPIATIAEPPGPWGVVGFSGGLTQFEIKDGRIHRRTIDPIAGVVSSLEPLAIQPISTGRIWQVSLLLALSISGLLLVFLIKPVGPGSISLPEGVEAMPLGSRLAALIIDLFPSGLVTVLVLDCSFKDLLSVPLVTIDIERSLPYLVMALLTVVHSTFAELMWRTSLGKSMLGARIMRVDGADPPARQVLLRGIVKFIILMIPPLGLFALVSPNTQGLDDLAASTMVVQDVHPDEPT